MRTDDAPADDHLLLDEADARRLLLARALEQGDREGRFVGLPEREQADAQAIAEAGDPALGQPLDERRYLLSRAGRITGLLAGRQPALAGLQHPPAWQAWLAWGLPLLAFAAGALVDRIDNPKQVNLLSPPLLAFLLWNLAVYVVLAVLALRGPRAPGEPLLRRWPAMRPRSGGVRADVLLRFQQAWWSAAGALEGQRWRAVLHGAAAAWALGIAASIVLGGLVREYRVGWESTLLDLPQVHAFLRVLFAPAVALLPVEPFTQAELARLHFGSGAGIGREEARRWVGLYVALLVILVVLPRLALAAWAATRQRILARRIRDELADPDYTEVLGRVRPARIVVGIAGAGAGPHPLETCWLQMAERGLPAVAGEPWPVLRSVRGASLQVRPWRPPGAPPAAAPGPWGRRGRGAPERMPASGVPHVLVAVADANDAAPGADWLAQAAAPVLVIATGGSEAALASQLRQHAAPAKVLAAADLPTWREDERLLLALQSLLPPYLAPGLQRLRESWREGASRRFDAAMQVLAEELVQAAADAQELPSQPLGMRQLVVRGEREASAEARRQAFGTLLSRARERRAATDARLLTLHALPGLAAATLVEERLPQRFRVEQAVHEPQAGLAGAAGGAAMGAAVDLATGGLTLGAASALGALIGGGAALAAAAWKNRGTGQGVAVVAFGEEMLDAFARGALLRYLAVVHERRAGPQDAQRWAEAVDAACANEQEALRAAWRRVRGEGEASPSSAEPAAELAQRLRGLAAQLLESLGGPV